MELFRNLDIFECANFNAVKYERKRMSKEMKLTLLQREKL